MYELYAVGSWQIILPMPNLGRPYYSDQGSESILGFKKCLPKYLHQKLKFDSKK